MTSCWMMVAVALSTCIIGIAPTLLLVGELLNCKDATAVVVMGDDFDFGDGYDDVAFWGDDDDDATLCALVASRCLTG